MKIRYTFTGCQSQVPKRKKAELRTAAPLFSDIFRLSAAFGSRGRIRAYSYQVGFGKASEHAIPAPKRGSLRPFWTRISTSPTVTM